MDGSARLTRKEKGIEMVSASGYKIRGGEGEFRVIGKHSNDEVMNTCCDEQTTTGNTITTHHDDKLGRKTQKKIEI